MTLGRADMTISSTEATHKEQAMNLGLRRLLPWLVAVLATLAFLGVGVAGASAAPMLDLHVNGPEAFEPEEPVEIENRVENNGDAAFSGPITVENTFAPGIVPVEPVLVVGERESSSMSCTLVGQTSTCTVEVTGNLTGEGILPGGWFGLNFVTHAEPAAAGETLVHETTVEGGGAFEAATKQMTVHIGPPEPFGLRGFRVSVANQDLSNTVQAGSSPQLISNEFEVTSFNDPLAHLPMPWKSPTEPFRTTIVHTPPGVIGNPNAVTVKCNGRELAEGESGEGCPPASQVGFVHIEIPGLGPGFNIGTAPLYMMEAPPGKPAMFGFSFLLVPSVLTAELRPDYGLDIVNRNAVASLPLSGADVTFWGVPNDPSHDTQRNVCLRTFRGQVDEYCPSGAPPTAFLRMPTSCPSQPLFWEQETDSYVHPGDFKHASTTTPAPVGCNQLEFTPTMEARPTTNVADAPSGLEFHLHLPQNDDPEALAEATLKDAAVTLPPGMTINPASANGLGSCGSAEIGLTTAIGAKPVRFTTEEPHCPDPSRLGSVEIDTPLVDHPLKGSVFLATPYDNPYHTLIALYFTVVDPKTGTMVKIPARVSPDPTTGQLTAVTEETPQLPFEDFHVNLDPGPHASLRTPAACGSFSSTSVMTPWTTPEGADAKPADSFQIVKGANGGACSSSASQLPNSASFSAGTLNPKAGAYTPFAFKVVRADGTQELKSIDTTLPPGLLGRLAGVGYCNGPELAAAAANSGRAEQASPSCPASSRVGSVNVGAGAGPGPFYASGNVYLSGPYKGAPYSLAFVVPAVAGPFDLGTVVTRAALYVDPETTQIHAVSDPLPTILQGIPLDVRSVAVNFDRNQFTLNPTSCDPMSVTGTLGTVLGQSLAVSNPFQVGGCQDLGFKPKLSFSLKGGTKRSQHPQLRVVLKGRPGDANIAWSQVTLPHSEFLAQNHLHDICTRVQFAAHECPAKSIYGYAKAVSPLLAQPIEGPVYLRSSSHKLPDLVVALQGQFEVDLDAMVDTGKNDGLRTTFEMVPDAPVSEFVLAMKGGRKGLLENSTDICRGKRTVNVMLNGHNGKTADATPVLKVKGCHKAKRHKHKSKKHK